MPLSDIFLLSNSFLGIVFSSYEPLYLKIMPYDVLGLQMLLVGSEGSPRNKNMMKKCDSVALTNTNTNTVPYKRLLHHFRVHILM